MEKGKVNISVVGFGQWAPNLVRNFSQMQDVFVSKVCDIDPRKLEAVKSSFPLIQATSDYNNLITDPSVDAVIIATPVFAHFELAKKALENGKHVFLEKPMTASSKEAEELINIANERNLVVMVDHIFLHSPAIKKIKEIVAGGELGDIHYVHAEWLSLGRLQPEVNVIWDLGVHVFASLNYILGKKPTSVIANAKGYFRKNIEEMADVFLNFPQDIKAHVKVSWTEPEKTRKITIVGSKKMLVYNMLDPDPVKIHNKSVNISDTISYIDDKVESQKIDNTEPLKESCSNFIECIKSSKVPLTDGNNGLEIIKILEATDNSIKSNGNEVFLE